MRKEEQLLGFDIREMWSQMDATWPEYKLPQVRARLCALPTALRLVWWWNAYEVACTQGFSKVAHPARRNRRHSKGGAVERSGGDPCGRPSSPRRFCGSGGTGQPELHLPLWSPFKPTLGSNHGSTFKKPCKGL